LTSFSGFRKRRLSLSMSMGPWSLKCLSRLSSILPIGPDDDQNFRKMVTRYWQPLANFCGSQRLANTLWALHSFCHRVASAFLKPSDKFSRGLAYCLRNICKTIALLTSQRASFFAMLT
jgi:hypothetical protein